MRTRSQVLAVFLAFISTYIISVPTPAAAQVLEATLYGIAQDTSGAVLPGVTVTVRH